MAPIDHVRSEHATLFEEQCVNARVPLLKVLANLRADPGQYGIRLPRNGVPIVIDIECHTAPEVPVASQIGTKIDAGEGLVAEGSSGSMIMRRCPMLMPKLNMGLR